MKKINASHMSLFANNNLFSTKLLYINFSVTDFNVAERFQSMIGYNMFGSPLLHNFV